MFAGRALKAVTLALNIHVVILIVKFTFETVNDICK